MLIDDLNQNPLIKIRHSLYFKLKYDSQSRNNNEWGNRPNGNQPAFDALDS